MDEELSGLAELIRSRVLPLVPDDRTLEALAQSARRVHAAKGEPLLRAGEPATALFFVQGGLLRYFYIDAASGLERTGQFFEAGQVLTDARAFLTGEPATQTIEALEPSVIVSLPRTALYKACDEDHAIERFCRLLAEEALTGSQLRTARMLLLSPDERYRLFLASRRALAERLPQYLIASYLGITPEALSRIRARAVTKKPSA